MQTRPRIQAAALAGALLLAPTADAGWQDWFKKLDETVGPAAQKAAPQALGLSQQEIGEGLKQALDTGIRRAVDYLGRDGGFLNHPEVKIPLPDTLQKVESGLRAFGQGKLADEFVTTMNHAAERAVPETVNIFADTVRDMTLDDAKAILNGPDDAATRYLREHGGARLTQAIRPIVQDATQQTGVTSAYKALASKAGFLGQFVDQGSLDIDGYVTDKAMDGLFLKLAEEEKRIREDPVARTTDVLKKVFGAAVR